MDAFFSLSLSYSGSAEEVALITDIINSYNTEKNGVFICLKQPVVENGITTVSAEGPYGSFGELNEVPIFRELAEAAPGANHANTYDSPIRGTMRPVRTAKYERECSSALGHIPAVKYIASITGDYNEKTGIRPRKKAGEKHKNSLIRNG